MTEQPGSGDWLLAKSYLTQRPTKWRSLSWIAARTLIASVNDRLIRLTQNQVGDLREHWVDGKVGDDLRITAHAGATRFVVAGDPGEQDGSQYVVAPALARAANAAGVGFVLLLSDVIYPSGDINDYVDGFYKPYSGALTDGEATFPEFQVNKPIYGVAGNHDWYDGLLGFAYHFLIPDQLTDDARRAFDRRLAPEPDGVLTLGQRIGDRFGRTMWRGSDSPNSATRNARSNFRARPAAAGQPGPYFVIETAHLDVVCVDTGVDGWLDGPQQAWLESLPRTGGRRRVLMTGKPLVVDGERKATGEPGPATSSFDWLEKHVRDPLNGYVAVIGGDVHNFQEYRDEQRPDLVHLVSGGAGAYTHATHPIRFAKTDPRVEVTASPEAGKGLFPHPAESLSYFASQLVPSIWRLSRTVFLFLAALVGAYWLIDIDWQRTVGVAGYEVTVGLLGSFTAAALIVLAARSLLPLARTSPLQRILGGLLAALAGVVATLFAGTHLGTDTGPVLEVYVWSTAWLCLNSLGLRLTEWWRPVAQGSVPWWRHASFWIGLPVSLATAVVAAWVLAGLDWIEMIALTAFGVVALWGWFSRVSASDPFGENADPSSATWLSRSVLWASLAQAVVIMAILRGVLQEIGRGQLLYAGLAALPPLLLVVVVCLGVPLFADAAFLFPGTAAARRDRWLRIARVTRPLALGAPLLVIAAWGLFVDATESTLLRAGFGAAGLLVLVVESALTVDLLRRVLGRVYSALVTVLVITAVGVLHVTGWYDAWPFVTIASSMLTLVAIGMAVLATHLVFVGALWLLVYWGAHGNPAHGAPSTAEANGHWSFLSARDAMLIVRARQNIDLEALGERARPSRRGWRLAKIAFPGLNPPFGPIQRYVSELYSLDEPPFFKHFLELSTTQEELQIAVHKVRGDLPVEVVTIRIPFPADQQAIQPAVEPA